MITFENGVQDSVSWVWKQASPDDFITFNISGESCMKIFNIANEEVAKLEFGYEKNRLFFDGDGDFKIHVVAAIKDYSNLPTGMYRYEILIESLIDDLKIEGSGELEIING
jgi:hypothetical protein